MSSSERILRWGLLGTARINDRIIDAVALSERSRVTAVASRNAQKARSYACQRGIPDYFDDYGRMLESPDVDVVYLALPNWLHGPWGLRVARAGKHVLIEKPLAILAGEVEQLERAAREHGVVIQEASMMRFHPQTEMLADLVAEGTIGVPRWVSGSFSFNLLYSDDIRLDPRGGGSIWDLGCYPVTLFGAVLERRPVEVAAFRRSAGRSVDMTFGAQILYQGGVVGQFVTSMEAVPSWGAEFVGSEGRIRVSYPWLSQVELVSRVEVVVGAPHRGLLPPDSETDRRAFGDEVGDLRTETHTFEGANAYLEEVKAMEEMVLDGAHPAFPLSESRINMGAIRALIESSISGKVVKIDV